MDSVYIYIRPFTNRLMGHKPWTRHCSSRDQSIGLDTFFKDFYDEGLKTFM